MGRGYSGTVTSNGVTTDLPTDQVIDLIGQFGNVIHAKPSGNPPVEGATPGKPTSGSTTQWEKPGGYDAANDDFDSLSPSNVRPLPNKGGGRIGTLPDGRTIIVRPNSTEGHPTLEIQGGKNGGKGKTKIRYN